MWPGWRQAATVAITAQRLAALRAELRRRRLSGIIVPRGDEHHGEYVAARSERLAWLTGFTGSAGTAVVLADKAALFVDGRYTVQAAGEVDGRSFTIRHSTHEPLAEWLAEHLPAKARLGYDPWLHTPHQVATLTQSLRDAAMRSRCRSTTIRSTGSGPTSRRRRWRRSCRTRMHFAGRPAEEKRARSPRPCARTGTDAAVLTQPDAIAWLLNIRGGDVPYTPLPLAFAVVEGGRPGRSCSSIRAS